ncbi:MAG: thioredoxin family protein [Anaerocolumna sp.]
MKSVIMFETSWCPYCKQAHKFMDELMHENPKYKELDIKVIDEEQEPDVAKQYNYYYVPTYYLDSKKVHEGIPRKDIIRILFENALSQ